MTRTVSTHAYRLSAEGFQRVQKELAKLGKDGDRAFKQLERAAKPANRQLGALGQVAGNLASGVIPRLAGAFAGLASAFAVGKIAAFGDELVNLRSRIRLYADDLDAATAAEERLIDIAQDTGGELGGLGELFARLAPARDELGATDAQLLRLTESLQKLAVVSGAAPQEASNAFRQLAQGLAAGALRGDEFNSVAEQMPAVMRLVAEELGTTTGKLREMAADGAITADVVMAALLKRSEDIDKQFEAMGATVGRSGQRVANAFKVALGDAATQSGLVDALAGSFDRLAEAISSPAFQSAAVGALSGLAAAIEAASIATGVLVDHIGVLSGAIVGGLAGRAVIAGASALQTLGGAMGAVSAATSIATGAMVALRAAMGFLFGPVGLAITAGAVIGGLAGAWATSSKAQGEANDLMNEAIDLQRELTGVTGDLTDAQDRRTASVIDGLVAEIEQQREIARRFAELSESAGYYRDEASNDAVRQSLADKARAANETLRQLEGRLEQLRAMRDDIEGRGEGASSTPPLQQPPPPGNGGDGSGQGGAARTDDPSPPRLPERNPNNARALEVAEQAREIVDAMLPARQAVADYERQITLLEEAQARAGDAGEDYAVALGLLREARDEAARGSISQTLEQDEIAYIRLRQEIEATGRTMLDAARAQEVLSAAHQAGHASAEDYARLTQQIADASANGFEAIDGFAKSAASGLAQLALDADASISDMLASFARLKAGQLLEGGLEALLSAGGRAAAGFFGGGAAGAGGASGGLFASLFHSGGVVGADGGPRRAVSPALFASAPRYHTGFLAPDEYPAILQRGESVLTPAQMRALGPAAAPQISIKVNNNASGAQATARAEPDGQGGARVSIDVIDAIADRAGERLATGPTGRLLGLGRNKAIRRS